MECSVARLRCREILEHLPHATLLQVGQEAPRLDLSALPLHPFLEQGAWIGRRTVTHRRQSTTHDRLLRTPLPQKLDIKEGADVALLHAPADFELDPLPAGVTLGHRLGKRHDVIVAFVDERSHLEKAIPLLEKAVFPDGAIWIAWPKKASKRPTDMTENVIRDVALPRGLVDVKVCAVDEAWSGLKLVWRKERRS